MFPKAHLPVTDLLWMLLPEWVTINHNSYHQFFRWFIFTFFAFDRFYIAFFCSHTRVWRLFIAYLAIC